jgi:hypothetical protein
MEQGLWTKISNKSDRYPRRRALKIGALSVTLFACFKRIALTQALKAGLKFLDSHTIKSEYSYSIQIKDQIEKLIIRQSLCDKVNGSVLCAFIYDLLACYSIYITCLVTLLANFCTNC